MLPRPLGILLLSCTWLSHETQTLVVSSAQVSLAPFSNTSAQLSRTTIDTNWVEVGVHLTKLTGHSERRGFQDGSPSTTREVDVCVSQPTGVSQSYKSITAGAQILPASSHNSESNQLLDWEFPTLASPYDWASYSAANESFRTFGRDPACTSAFSSFAAIHPMTVKTTSSLIPFTNVNGQTSISTRIDVMTLPTGTEGYCCTYGLTPELDCFVQSETLQMVYFPAPNPNIACLEVNPTNISNHSAPITQAISVGKLARSNQSAYAAGLNGFIYTSPSIYLEFPLVSAYDKCGILGPVLSSVTLGFKPEEVSSLPDFPFSRSERMVNTSDLPCGPSPQFASPRCISTTQAGYHPYIALPSKLKDLASEWSQCAITSAEAQDPPHALSRAGAMVPAPTKFSTYVPSSKVLPSPSIPPIPNKTATLYADVPAGNNDGRLPDYGPAAKSPILPIVDPHPGLGSNFEKGPNKVQTSGAGSIDSNALSVNGYPVKPPAKNVPEANPQTFANVPPNHADTLPNGNGASLRSNLAPSDGYLREAHSPSAPLLVPLPSLEIHGDPSSPPSSNNDPSNPSSSNNDPSNPSSSNNGEAHPPPSKDNPSTPPAIEYHDHPIIANSDPTTIAGKQVIYQSGNVHVGNDIQPLAAASSATVMNVGGIAFDVIPANSIRPWTGSQSDYSPSGDLPKNGASEHGAGFSANPVEQSTRISAGSEVAEGSGQILKPGDPPITIAETPISLGASAFVIGAQSSVSKSLGVGFSNMPNPAQTRGDLSLDKHGDLVDGDELGAAQSGGIVEGSIGSSGSSDLVGGSVLPASPPVAFARVGQQFSAVIDGHTIAPLGDLMMVDGKQILPGSPPVSLHDEPVSLGSSNLVIGTKTLPLPSQGSNGAKQETPVTVGNMIVNPSSNYVIIAGKTVMRGAPPTTIYGTPISLGSSAVVIGSHTLSFLPQQSETAYHQGLTSIDGYVTIPFGKPIVIAGKTITPGAPITMISGTLVSLGSSILVVGSHAERLADPASAQPPSALITVANDILTKAASDFIIKDQTLVPGGAPATIDGTVVSLGSSMLVVGSSMAPIDSPAMSVTHTRAGESITDIITSKSVGAVSDPTSPPSAGLDEDSPASAHPSHSEGASTEPSLLEAAIGLSLIQSLIVLGVV